MPEPVFTSALSGRSAPAALSVSMREVVDRGMIDLRGDAKDPAFLAAVGSVLGFDLPLKPRTSSLPPTPTSSPSPGGGECLPPLWGKGRGGGDSQAPLQALWLSTDQWLIFCPRAGTSRLLAALREKLSGIHSLAVDLSDARTVIRIEGEAARTVLMKSVPLDLTSPEYRAGTVRRLRFGEIAALIHIVRENPDAIDLYVFRSYAEFAWDLLLATASAASALNLFGGQEPPL